MESDTVGFEAGWFGKMTASGNSFKVWKSKSSLCHWGLNIHSLLFLYKRIFCLSPRISKGLSLEQAHDCKVNRTILSIQKEMI